MQIGPLKNGKYRMTDEGNPYRQQPDNKQRWRDKIFDCLKNSDKTAIATVFLVIVGIWGS
jgi:hypothetical protein